MRVLTHQILTPVQGAINDIEQLESIDDDVLQRLENNIDEIKSIAKQIHVLLSECLAPSAQSIRHINIREVINRICDRLNSLTRAKELEFKVGKPKGIWDIEAVPDLFEIAFRCLLENSAKYAFRGCNRVKRHVDVYFNETRRNGERTLKVSIENYGCLITEEEIRERKIFELGYRGDYSGDRGRQGTGSGLYIASQIVESHRGIIEVESREDEPTPTGEPQAINTFHVYWPKFFA